MSDAKQVNWIEKVYEMVRKIPKGKVTTYGTIADNIGVKATSRMIGWAMNACEHIKPRVPAHRVVNRKGELTGRHHFATPTLMQELLEAEGVEVADHKIVHFKDHYWQPNGKK